MNKYIKENKYFHSDYNLDLSKPNPFNQLNDFQI